MTVADQIRGFVAEHPGCATKDVAEALGMPQPVAGHRLRELTYKGHLARVAGLFSLAERGQALAQRCATTAPAEDFDAAQDRVDEFWECFADLRCTVEPTVPALTP